jgi:hypothetical protein
MKTNLIPMLKSLMPQLILVLTIYIVLLTLPSRNIISINLTIITIILMYKLYNNINNKQTPKPLEWIKTTLTTSAWTTGFIILYTLLGGYGLIGFISIIIILVAWRIIKGWKLFNYTTKWGANILHGKKEDFDITMLEPEKINKFDPILKDLTGGKP